MKYENVVDGMWGVIGRQFDLNPLLQLLHVLMKFFTSLIFHMFVHRNALK